MRRGLLVPPALALLSTAAFAGAALDVVDTWRTWRDLMSRRIEQVALEGRITWLDEVLTMSARMAVATGDPSWIVRYEAYGPQLDVAIFSLRDRSGVEDLPAVREMDAANQALVEMERGAFALLERGETTRAWALVTGPAYTRRKTELAELVAAYQRDIDRSLSDRIEASEVARTRALTVGAVVALSMALAWTGLVALLLSARRKQQLHNEALAAMNVALNAVVQERTEAMQLLEVGRRAKEDLLANVAHEIRTPLNGIVGASDLLRDNTDPAERAMLLDTITAGGRTLAALVNGVLDLSKLDRGEVVLEQAPVDVRRLAEETVGLLRPLATQKSLALVIRIGDDVPPEVEGDATRLGQVLLNLLGNAIKFTERGHVALAVRCIARDLGCATLAFGVHDTGIGVAPARQRQIFEPYAQADSSTTRRFGGTGLGLTIVRSLVRRMGGEIRLDSVVGHGSTFHFELKLPLATAPLARLSDVPLAPGRALVAEDNPVNVKIIEGLMRRLGWQIDVASDGQEALEKSRQGRYDVIILDCQMPVMDGFTAARAMRADETISGRRTPILALTANVTPGDQHATLASGMDAHLAKPITRKALRQALAQWAA